VSFSLVGGLGVFVHLLTVWLCLKMLGLEFVPSQVIATFVAMTSNYSLNNVLTNRDMRLRGWKWLRGWISFTAACSIGAIANVGIASYVFAMDETWVIAALSGVLVGAVWNYAVTMTYTWKKSATI